MYGDIVDMDFLYNLMWVYYLPFEVFVFFFNLGFWGCLVYFGYRAIRDFWESR